MPYTTAQWQRFLRLIGRDDLAQDPEILDMRARSRRFEELYALIAEVTPTRSTEDWVRDLAQHDILFGKVNSPEDLLSDPHLQALNMFPMIDDPEGGGQLRLIGFPASYSRTPQRLRHAPPRIGQHTSELLQELGYAAEEIAVMRSERAIVCD
jgi:formyl-CoA transferase